MLDDNIYIGIDYSISSPAMCIIKDDITEIHCFHKEDSFFYLVDKNLNDFKIITYTLNKKSLDLYEYYEKQTDIIISAILQSLNSNNYHLSLEDYSFSSNGKVFNIGEATGILKYKLYKNKLPYVVFSPKTIKKFTTGNGNSNKDNMVDQFYQDTDIDLFKSLQLNRRKTIPSPITDIVDSYYQTLYLKHITTTSEVK
ncbi:MAG: hypothetical protein KC589_06120 [Nanoarchaeota archaeon]|nr:hypothetical protein [Nanoarchaeota archaeon]